MNVSIYPTHAALVRYDGAFDALPTLNSGGTLYRDHHHSLYLTAFFINLLPRRLSQQLGISYVIVNLIMYWTWMLASRTKILGSLSARMFSGKATFG